LQDQIPPPAPPVKTELVREVAGVVRRRGRVLLVQRPSRGRWANMWEFPHGTWKKGQAAEDAVLVLLRDECGIQTDVKDEILTLRHSVTRFRITISCFDVAWIGGQFRSEYYQAGRWLLPRAIQSYPVSVPQRQLAKALMSPVTQARLF